MIRNERQYRITKAQAGKFRAAIAAAERAGPAPKVHQRLHQASLEGMRSQLEDLERDLAAFEDLKTPKRNRTIVGPGHEIGGVLTQARIARGWTQRELAERVGLQMQKIQQYEAGGYDRASLARVAEICQVLGVESAFSVRLVDLPSVDELASRRSRASASTRG